MAFALTIGMSDAAKTALGTEFDVIDNDDDYVASTCPTFHALLAEAEKRGLEEGEGT